MYLLNPAAYGSVFVLPDAVADNFIFLSSELQLKVLLVIARNSLEEKTPSAIASFLKKNEDDVKDALDFWVDEGILISDGQTPVEIKKPAVEEKKNEAQKISIAPIPVIKPTMEQVIARTEESPELRYLFECAQEMLGRTIGWDGQSRLLMMYDNYGLPADVILMLLEYLKSTGRTSWTDITKYAKIWAEDDIKTHEKANEYIDRMNKSNSVYDELKTRFGIAHERPSTKQAQFITDWLNLGFSTELIARAYDEMINNTQKPSFAYVNTILISWHKKGYRTTSDVEKGESREKDVKKKEKKPSYDIEKAKQKDKTRKLKYEKKVKI